MPTENRSSNTEMVSVQAVHGLAEKVREALDRQACPNAWMVTAYEAVVANFPQPAPQPHPAPIAWIVGTAFWWTKEEAERDAVAMGLPIVGLGPMRDTAEVERLRAELRVQDALLEEAYQRDIGTPLKRAIRAQHVGLSASAEVSEPMAEVKP